MVKKDRGQGLEIIAMIALFTGLALLVTFCGPRKAQAFVPTPSPTPSPALDVPEQVGRAVSVNVIGIVGVALLLTVVMWLVMRNMRKHEDS